MSEIDLLLINPNNKKAVYGDLALSFAACEPPLFTALLAAFIRQKGYSVKIIDADAEGWDLDDTAQKIDEFKPLLTGIGALGANPSASSTPKMEAAGKLLDIIRKNYPNIKTFLYGIHPSALPEKTLKEETVDFVCCGECFYSVLELLKILKSKAKVSEYNIRGLWYKKNGEVISNGWGEWVDNLDFLPPAAWDLLPMEKYRAHNWHCFGRQQDRQPYAVIYTSLGCPFDCDYCNIHALYTGKPKIRYRSLEKVIAEIDLLVREYKIKSLKIIDELFVLKHDRVNELCDLLIERGYNLNIWAYARVDTVNESLLTKMKQAGINWLCYGIESASKKVRDNVNKGTFGQETIKRAIAMARQAGIYVIGNFMFGLPEDNLETMQETLDLAKELQCEYVNFYVAMAYPGSRLYEDSVAKNIPLPKTWVGYSQLSSETLPMPTRFISSKEILNFRDRAFEDYYTDPQYLNMIEKIFGLSTVEHINQMLKLKINRKYA